MFNFYFTLFEFVFFIIKNFLVVQLFTVCYDLQRLQRHMLKSITMTQSDQRPILAWKKERDFHKNIKFQMILCEHFN